MQTDDAKIKQDIRGGIESVISQYYLRYRTDNVSGYITNLEKASIIRAEGSHVDQLLRKNMRIQRKDLLKAQLADMLEQTVRSGITISDRLAELNKLFGNELEKWIEQTLPVMYNIVDRMSFRNAAQSNSNSVFQDLDLRLIKLSGLIKVYKERDDAISHVPSGASLVRFISDSDKKTCKACSERAGEVHTLDEFIRLGKAPPLHPNCRCKLEPVSSAEHIPMPRVKAEQADDKLWGNLNTATAAAPSRNYIGKELQPLLRSDQIRRNQRGVCRKPGEL